MRKFLSFLFLSCSAVFGANSEFSRTTQARRQELINFLNLPPEKRIPWYQRPFLTGDWHGFRTDLANKGLTFSFQYTTDTLGNPVGGRAHGIAYAGSLGADMNFDFSKTTNLEDLQLYVSFVWRTGTSLTERKIGNQFPVQQVFGSQTWKINEIYLRKELFEQKVVIKAGRLDTGNDFLASTFYSWWVSNAFDGNPISIFFNGFFSAYPVSTWGAMTRIQAVERFNAKFGIYNANTDVGDNRYHGMHLNFNGQQGALLNTEWTLLTYDPSDKKAKQGKIRGGFFTTTGPIEKFEGGTVHTNPTFYVHADQMIYQPDKETPEIGLSPFVVAVFAKSDRATFPFFIDGGLHYKGLFPSRPKDSTNLGFAYGRYSHTRKRLQEEARERGDKDAPLGTKPQTYELILELNHWFQCTPSIIFVPDIQYVVNPKGFGKIPNALVVGFQASLTF